jgi:hypothetical protein
MTQETNLITTAMRTASDWVSTHVADIGAETLGWVAVILLHSATVPTLLAILTGLSDKTPTVDLVLLVWAGLAAIFAQAVVNNNRLIVTTVALGFMVQASLMALIFFK